MIIRGEFKVSLTLV